jgi:hypothetical protein
MEHEELINTLKKKIRGCVINLEVKLGVQDTKIKKHRPRHEQKWCHARWWGQSHTRLAAACRAPDGDVVHPGSRGPRMQRRWPCSGGTSWARAAVPVVALDPSCSGFPGGTRQVPTLAIVAPGGGFPRGRSSPPSPSSSGPDGVSYGGDTSARSGSPVAPPMAPWAGARI